MEENQIQPKPIPATPPEEKKVDRRTELAQKKARNRDRLPPDEEKELAAILAKEAEEHHREALVFRISERADKVNRKEAARLRRQVTDHVAGFSSEKNGKVKGFVDEYRTGLKSLEKITESAIQELRETFNRQKKVLEEGRDAELAKINQEYADRFSQAEQEMKDSLIMADLQTEEFKTVVKSLSLEQLEELEMGKAVKIPGGGADEYIALANPDPS